MSRFQSLSARYLDFSLRSTEHVCNYMASWFVYPISLIITDDPKATAILISSLLICMICTALRYPATHSLGLSVTMIGMHKTQSDEARLDVLSLIM